MSKLRLFLTCAGMFLSVLAANFAIVALVRGDGISDIVDGLIGALPFAVLLYGLVGAVLVAIYWNDTMG